MLYRIGRFFQFAGLLITPVGIAGNVLDEQKVDLRTSLTIAGVGVAVFVLGWLLQQGSRPE